MLQIKFKKENGSIIYPNVKDRNDYKLFIDMMKEGEEGSVYFEYNKSDHSLTQLAKVHKMIRLISAESGATFQEIKNLIKSTCGYVDQFGQPLSFSNISKEELSKIIEECNRIAELLNIKTSI